MIKAGIDLVWLFQKVYLENRLRAPLTQ